MTQNVRTEEMTNSLKKIWCLILQTVQAESREEDSCKYQRNDLKTDGKRSKSQKVCLGGVLWRSSCQNRLTEPDAAGLVKQKPKILQQRGSL